MEVVLDLPAENQFAYLSDHLRRQVKKTINEWEKNQPIDSGKMLELQNHPGWFVYRLTRDYRLLVKREPNRLVLEQIVKREKEI